MYGFCGDTNIRFIEAGLNHTALWRWLTEHGIPRDKRDEQAMRVLFSTYNQKKVAMDKQETEGYLPLKSKD